MSPNKIIINVYELIGNELCITSEDGQKVFDVILPLLNEGNQVIVSFKNIKMIISLFLNSAIGQLYGSFDEDVIKKNVEITNLAEDDLNILARVRDNAKIYYANKDKSDAVWEGELDDEE